MKCISEIWTCLFRMLLQGFGTGPVLILQHPLPCQQDSVGTVAKDVYISDWIFMVHIEYPLSLCQ